MSEITGALRSSTTDEPETLSPDDLDAWDELAAQVDEPYGGPAWCLAWWRHVAPEGSLLRVIRVHDGDELVALAPFWCHRAAVGPVRYRLLGSETSPRLQPLAAAATRADAARYVATALAAARPRPDAIELGPLPCDSDWPELIADAWPGRRPRIDRGAPVIAPAVALHGDHDAWLAGKSRNFRQQARRHRRRLGDRGATFRVVADPAEAVVRLADFERLHEARWRYRGGSGVLDTTVMCMLRDAAAAMVPPGRMQVHLVEADGAVIAVHLFLTGGGTVSYWLGGFDDDWGNDQPSLQALIDVIARAQAAGMRRLDLGPGAQAYKDRLSDDEDRLCTVTLYPPGPRRALAVAAQFPGRAVAGARQRAFAALSTERKDQIKRVLRKVRS